MQYSKEFKEKAMRRVLPPDKESVLSVARELGISSWSIYNWLKKYKNGIKNNMQDVPVGKRSINEKLQLFLESTKVPKEKIGEWLRANGLHSEHLKQFEQEITTIMTDKTRKEKEEIKALKQENKQLKKELHRKEKALAETAALLTLKKKAEAIWGENEED